MANYSVLGLFHEAAPTAEAIEGLRQLGLSDEQLGILSGIPYQEEMLGLRREPRPVARIALIGAILGLLFGLFLSVGIWLLYPLHQGGQPVVPIPPTLIVLFETTMLGTMWATFFGLLGENRFPAIKQQIYDPRITEGHIGVVAEVEEALVAKVEALLVDHGAHHMRREPVDKGVDVGRRRFWLVVGGGATLVAALLLLLTYDVIEIPFGTQMEHQASVAYLEGPRKAAPAASVPIQGPLLIVNQPASEPLATDQASLQRGQVLFGIICVMCHGNDGTGDGPLSGFFDPHPADLTGDEVQNLADEVLFLAVVEGRGAMPSMAENLSANEVWDVINYVRSLASGSEG
ncbi:MAG: c-type cytochrome [Candidatus Promineifilaceae bacterium]